MQQWFKDMNDIQKHRDNMEYITKGGRKPKHWEPTNEGIENETRFLPHLKRTYENLYREYEHWQYATYKPQGMDDAIDAIIAAMHSVQDIIREIEPDDNIPTWEDPQQYSAASRPTSISDHFLTSPIDLSNIWANLSDSLIFRVFQRYTALCSFLNYTTKVRKSPALWGLFIRIIGYFCANCYIIA